MKIQFASSKKAFKASKLHDLITSGKKQEADDYVATYFVKSMNPTCFFFWTGSDLVQLDSKGLGHYLDRSLKIEIEDKVNHTRVSFNAFDSVARCYLDERLITGLINDPSKKRVIKRKNGIYLNTNQGFKFLGTDWCLTDFEDDILQGVTEIWKHIKQVLCNDDEQQYIFFKKWICATLKGQKMESSIYLQSVQGTGKSMILQFLRDVIGKPSLKPKSAEVFFSKHNEELEGKSFVVLEELQDADKSRKDLYTKMKELITGKDMMIDPKFKKPYTTANRMNFIYASNEFGLKLNDTERRLLMLYCSDRYRGNKKYFDRLGGLCENKTVQHAFYVYALENYDETFDHRYPPSSNLKSLIMGERLSTVHKFIKSKVMKNHEYLTPNVKVCEVYEDYEEFCRLKRVKSISIQKFGHSMSQDFKIKSTSKSIRNVKQRVYNINRDDLFDIFEAKKWIHEDEGIFRDNQKIENKDFGFLEDSEEQTAQLKKENLDLHKQIEQLKAQLEQLTKSTKPEEKVEEVKTETTTPKIKNSKTKKTKTRKAKGSLEEEFNDPEMVEEEFSL